MAKELWGESPKSTNNEKIGSVDKVAQRKAELALRAELGLGRVEALSPEEQVEFYRERVLQMRQVLIAAAPIVKEHDKIHAGYDEYNLSDDIVALADLSKGSYRHLHLPSNSLADNHLPEGLTPQELWSACLDLVLHMNRGYGVTTNSLVKVPGAVSDIFNYGKVAHDPLRKPYVPPRSFVFRLIALVVGEKRLQKFVNRNSSIQAPRWLRTDVLDDKSD
jgi:hypothetical protein